MLAWPKEMPKSPRNLIVINLDSVLQEDGIHKYNGNWSCCADQPNNEEFTSAPSSHINLSHIKKLKKEIFNQSILPGLYSNTCSSHYVEANRSR